MAYKFKSTGASKPIPIGDLRYRDAKFPKEKQVARKKAEKMKKVMGEFKGGTLHSGSKTGPVVQSRKQAVAIGLSQIRKALEEKKRPHREY